MTKRVFETSLRAYQSRPPFRAFLIELKSGASLLVKHPEAVMTFAGAAVLIDPDGAITMFDADGVTRLSDRPSRKAPA